MKTQDPRNCRRRWRRVVKRLIPAATDLVISAHVYNEVRDIVQANPKIQTPDTFHTWVVWNYASTMSVGIRRLCDRRTDSISLYRLIHEITRSPQALSKRSHRALYPRGLEPQADLAFDRWAGQPCEHWPAAVALHDLSTLRATERRVRTYVNKRIAHLDVRNRRRRPPTFDELHSAVELIERLVIKYNLVLRAESFQRGLLPIWHSDWKAVFRHPWLAA